ncbi:MAG: glycine cleavage system protein H [Planctomycetes bacterium]|jgi:glycine cleavage system H protein|nr:glycine cleavage system protein H [Planctomycetota bacterium]MDP6408739.1 glycine cleavage system protein GcvH [Planctomycetota bacterium]
MRPDDRKYLETHEWAKVTGDIALIGLTDFAIHELCSGNEGDLVYCDLPETGRTLEVGETFGEIESVKAVADLSSPVEGEVIEVNEAIEDHLEILSSDPWEQGWMVKIKLTKKSMDHLIDAETYESMLAKQS